MECNDKELEKDVVISDNKLFSFKNEKGEDFHQPLSEKEEILSSLLYSHNDIPEDLVVVDFVPKYISITIFICNL